jgi:hypothetical protein
MDTLKNIAISVIVAAVMTGLMVIASYDISGDVSWIGIGVFGLIALVFTYERIARL